MNMVKALKKLPVCHRSLTIEQKSFDNQKKSLTNTQKSSIIVNAVKKYLGVAQLVACYLGVVEAAGSSPVTQTRENPRSFETFSELRGFLFFAKSACTTLSTTKK